MSDAAEKRTPLYEEHVRLGAKIIPFGGWLMPVQYSSIMEEHQAVRKSVGVFDISHMGELVATGQRAGEWLNTMLTNNIAKLEVGSGQYTFLLNDEAGIIDDLIVYRIDDQRFLLVVNASRIEDDFAWLQSHLASDVQLENQSDEYAGLAIQGPRVGELFQAVFGDGKPMPARNQIAPFDLGGTNIRVARTGYTGEDGIEVFFAAQAAPRVWKEILEKGKSLGIRPCGLGARDTLRLEMCYPLNGSDLSPAHNPLEAGLGFFVDLAKPHFTGREKLLRDKEAGLSRRLVPFKMKGKSPPPRPHYRVFRDGKEAGELTSGTLSPSLNYGIGMAYLTTPEPKPGEEIEIEIRGQKFPAVIEKKPLYKKS
ncbi:MAG TPA: glycine cleavage system aminomethyltransferase GcvT [Chthoniobacterales bacterium]|nr:glycine cleavage system aminomethyltransferase GcvT [Chthoniobacterales bacterium]